MKGLILFLLLALNCTATVEKGNFIVKGKFSNTTTSFGFAPPVLTTTQKNAISSPVVGDLVYDTTLHKFQFYYNSTWNDVGFASPLTTNGDIMFYNSGNTRLAIGDEGKVLTVSSGLPSWQSVPAQSSVTVGNGLLNGGTSTNATLSVNNSYITGLVPPTTTEKVIAVNIISNSGFETGDGTGWSSSGGTFAVTNTAANVAYDSYSGSFDASATSQYILTDAITVPNGLKLRNAVLTLMVKGGDTNLAVNILDASDVVIASKTLTGYTNYTRESLNFVMPDTAHVHIKIVSSADAAIVYVDDLFLGDASSVNISQISQSEIYGGVTIAVNASHAFSTTNATYQKVTDSDVVAGDKTHTGNAIITATAGDYGAGFSNLPAGKYEVTFTGEIYCSYSSSSTTCGWGMSDDGCTTTVNDATALTTSASSVSTNPTMTAYFTYTTTQASKEFVMCAKRIGGGGSTGITTTTVPSTFTIKRFPLSSEIAYKPETQNNTSQVTWSNVANCLFTNTSGIMTDADCNTGTVLGSATSGNDNLQLTMTNLQPGKYLVGSFGIFYASYASTTTACSFEVGDGTTQTGTVWAYANSSTAQGVAGSPSAIFEYTSVQPTKTFSIYSTRTGGGGSCNCEANSANESCGIYIIPLTQALPLPNLMNQIATPLAGGKNELTATLNCDSGSAITSQDGTLTNGVAAIGNVASGACAVTFAGIFSATPRCYANALGTTKDVRCQLNPTSSTAATLYITKPSDGTDLSAADCDIFCSGAK